MSFHGPLLEAPIPNLLLASGVLFLLVSIFGRLKGPIELQADKRERIVGGLTGIILITSGLWFGPAPIDLNPNSQPNDTSTPEGFHVYEADITIVVGDEPASEYQDAVVTKPCPITVQVRGEITAIGGSGQVTYRWITYGPYEKQDGEFKRKRITGPVDSINFNDPGTKYVYLYNDTVGGEGLAGSIPVNHTLKILEPNRVQINKQAEIQCE